MASTGRKSARRSDPRSRLRQDAELLSRRESGTRSFWDALGVLGAGWPVVMATAGGALAGRFLHARFGTGIAVTLVLVVAGAVAGMAILWHVIQPRGR
jgi:predicted F0F1-ATPase subunit